MKALSSYYYYSVHEERHPLQSKKTPYSLVVVRVAETPAADVGSTHRVHDVAYGDVGKDVGHVEDIAHAERVAKVVIPADGGCTDRWVSLLPAVEAVVDEAVVHPEDGVARAGRDIGHHAADTVVAIGVGSAAQSASYPLPLLICPTYPSSLQLSMSV